MYLSEDAQRTGAAVSMNGTQQGGDPAGVSPEDPGVPPAALQAAERCRRTVLSAPRPTDGKSSFLP